MHIEERITIERRDAASVKQSKKYENETKSIRPEDTSSRHWKATAEVWVETVTEGAGGGSWLRGGKKRKTRLNIARRRGKQRDSGKFFIAHGSVESCEATPFDLVEESKESSYGSERD